MCSRRRSLVRRSLVCALFAAGLFHGARVSAHPVPFSYLDVHLQPDAVESTLVLHIIDVAHDLGIEPAEQLLDPDFARARSGDIAGLVARRLALVADGRRLTTPWTDVEVLADRLSVRVRVRVPLAGPTGSVAIDGRLFPYDPNHKTFVNVYDGDALTQAILDDGRARFEYFAGSRQGRWAVVSKFIPSGIEHILIGPDHILFLVGLLLLGGTVRRLALVVTGFTAGHSVTLSLAALGIVTPPAGIVEPIIALSIVYVGLDNLLKRDGRDVRLWIALGFGLIHGFGFASVLRDMGLPAGALGWSLFSFNVGVEIGQLLIVAGVATVMAALRSTSEVLTQRLVFAGSLTVVVAGGFWFVERIGWLGGL
jgi:hydrogenase/urease accessory protein HupE